MTALAGTLGWIWLVAAPATAAVALGYVAWRAARPTAVASIAHRRAAAAYVLALMAVAAAPWAIGSRAGSAPASNAASAAPEAPAVTVPATAKAAVALSSAARRVDLGVVAQAVGLVWIAAAAWMAVRVGGGWWMVRRLVARARPCRSAAVDEAVRALAATLGRHVEVRIAESDEIDAPMVAGLRPTILLPPALAAAPAAERRLLLAHELAHAWRRDYLANLLQSVADAVLWALPPARWISARVRETREFACDEFAARVAGDVHAYVRALATVAAASLRRPAAALGAGGPRLGVRVDRLLGRSPRDGHRGLRVSGAIAMLAATVYMTGGAMALAARQQAAVGTPVPGHRFEVSGAYATELPGSAVTIRGGILGTDFMCDSFQVQNSAHVAVTGLVFSAVVSWPDAAPPDGPRVYTGKLVPVSIPPGGSANVDAHLLRQDQYGDFAHLASSFYVTCTMSKVTYANGETWELPRHLIPVTASTRFGLHAVEVSRAMMAPAVEPRPGFVCVDERRGEYSRGAVIPIRNEPGEFAQCVEAPLRGGTTGSLWIEYQRAR